MLPYDALEVSDEPEILDGLSDFDGGWDIYLADAEVGREVWEDRCHELQADLFSLHAVYKL